MNKYSIGISKSGKEFVALLFAGDINVYSVARAFYEEYGIVSKAYGMYPTGPCMDSVILDYTANRKADDPETFLGLEKAYAEENAERTVFVIGCGDNYVELASRFKNDFPENVIAPYIDIDLMHTLIHKERFYELCEKTGVDYPTTFVHKKEMGMDFELPFGGPFIVKPSNGVEYWLNPFETQKKVYKLDSFDEVKKVLGDIYASGYSDSAIIQNFIPGDDSYMRVLTSYSDKNGRVKMMCLGHVLLEEHTPHGIGNHAVIITETDDVLMAQIRELLESLHFVGFSNFDIKFDERDGRFKVFEINTRQGRSNYYVTGSGANIAKLLVSDLLDGEELQLNLVDNEHLWMVVPKAVAYKYVNKKYTAQMKRLVKEGKVCNPLIYSRETSLKKKYAVSRNLFSHFVKYKKYLK